MSGVEAFLLGNGQVTRIEGQRGFAMGSAWAPIPEQTAAKLAREFSEKEPK